MKMNGKILITFFTGFFSCFTVLAQEKSIVTITVESGNYQRYNAPVVVSLDDLELNGNIKLIEIKGNTKEEIPVQINKSENSLHWILFGMTEIGTTRTFELLATNAKKSEEVVAFHDEKGVNLKWNNNELIKYNSMPVELPHGVDSAYTRGAFIHPLKTLSGRILTRIQPEDHYHHVGIWNPWTKATIQGRKIDFWNLVKKQGTVRFKNLESSQSGHVFGGFRASQEHIDLTAPEGEMVAMNEEWDIKVYQPGDNPYYIVDFLSVIECATDSPITLNQYRYGGGIGFRATEDWNKNNCGVITSEGKTRLDGDATRAKWCNVFGTVNELKSGILFMCHPDNFSFPQPMRIWPEDANAGNGDMYFQFCPIRENNWHLEAGRQYFQKYRLIVYDGEISNEEAEQLWMDYSNPPEIIITKPNH